MEESKKKLVIGMPIMIVGFALAAAGALFLYNGAVWAKPLAISGFVVYLVGRMIHAASRR